MRQRIKQVSQFVHDYLMETGKDHENEPWGPKYRWEHTLRVAHWAWILAKEDDATHKPKIMISDTIATDANWNESCNYYHKSD